MGTPFISRTNSSRPHHMGKAVTILELDTGLDFSDDGVTPGSANIGVVCKGITSRMEYTPAAWERSFVCLL